MKTLIVLAFVLAVVSASVLKEDSEWKHYKKTHKKEYEKGEEAMRYKIYKENKKNIEKHNARYENGEVTFKRGINKFTDMLSHEVAEMMNGYKSGVRSYDADKAFKSSHKRVASTVDWRKKGYVTGIKDQGQCGCCWAFSTTGSLEGQLFKKNGKLVSLSEQNLVDCSTENEGCNGGLMNTAFEYIQQNGGIDTEKSYPFTGESSSSYYFYQYDQSTCLYNARNSAGTDTGYVNVQSKSESALKEAVATIGPISVAIDASHDSFQSYESGVYDESACSSTSLDHGVLVVGYGTENGQDYWLVKNSWGTSWGEQGYIKMARNRNNQCGIATEASYPTV